MKHQHSITSLPPSPEEDRRRRMVKYSVAMGIRVVCIALCLVVQGWWLVVFAVGAIVLPYFAVVVANAQRNQGTTVLRPGNVQPSTE
ncbi:MAG: DUF3099 domain-containing protein, partial [Microbacteriaceae bacterium]